MDDRTGQQFGNYRLIRSLGRGGFAEVYLGEHIHLQRQAAIKVLSTQIVGNDMERFTREARTIAALKHQHVVEVFDFGIENDIPFLVMEYAPNETLRQRHPKESRVSLDDVLSYVQQIASALQYAHDRRIIHRDVKPENMLLGNQGEVLLSDFGIAVTTATSTSRETKTTAGTVSYMAPEQIMGKPCLASDQYALGVIVYEWLSGKQPFHGSFIEICAQHLNAPFPSLRETNPEISPEVEQCIAKALSKDPEKRFASIQDFAAALQGKMFSDSNTGQDDPTVLKAQPDVPVPPQIGQDDPTMLKAQPEMPVSPQRGQDDPTVLKAQLSGSPLLDASQDEPTAKGAKPIVSGTTESSFIPVTRTKRRNVLMTKNITIIAVCFILLALLVAMPFLFSFSNGIWLVGAISSSPTAQHTNTPTLTQKSTPTLTVQSTLTPIPTQSSYQPQPTPKPPLTATPQPTPTPQSCPPPPTSDPAKLYNEVTSCPMFYSSNLSQQDNANWQQFTASDGGSCSFAGGGYRATMPTLGDVVQCLEQINSFSDFAFQVQMTIHSGANGDGGGLVFRSTSAAVYRLRIGLNGSYDLFPTGLSGTSSAIKTGLNQTNLLTVIAQGNLLSLYVNKQCILQTSSTLSNQGQIGVMAVAWSQAVDIMFTNAQVWKL